MEGKDSFLSLTFSLLKNNGKTLLSQFGGDF